MVHYIYILKNHLLYENTLIFKEKEKEQLLNTLNEQVLAELTQIGLENPEYKNLTDQFCLHIEFKYSPEKYVALAEKIRSALSESDLQTKQALRLVLNVTSFVEKK